MKLLKKLTAVLLVCIMVFSFAGCHKKGEIAVTIKDQKFTSGYYAYAFLYAYSEAQQLAEPQPDAATSGEIDYSKLKVEGKEFEQWVKDRAIETLKSIAYYKSLCIENKLELSKATKEEIKTTASYYWNDGGMKEFFTENGISLQTYTQYMMDSEYATLYFEHLYGKGGDKEIPEKELKEKLYNDFLIANILEFNSDANTTTDTLKAIKKQFDKYAEKIKNGELTFEEVYNEYNKIEETDQKETEEDHADHDHAEPKDSYASLMGATGTGFEHAYYDQIKKLKVGEIKVIEKEDDSGYILVVKQNIKKDNYYLDTYDMILRHLLKDEEYDKTTTEAYKKLTADINDFAVNQFEVENIKELEYGY